MIYIIEFLGKLLELVLSYKEKQDAEQTKQEYSAASSNPRDFFDDGVLNNSDSGSKTTSAVPSTDSPRQPE